MGGPRRGPRRVVARCGACFVLDLLEDQTYLDMKRNIPRVANMTAIC